LEAGDNMTFLSRSHSLSLPPFEEAHFWVIDLHAIQEKEVEEALKFLNQEAIDRANKLIFLEDRHRSIIVHAILRIYLEQITKKKPEILRDAFGKPYLKGHDLHFNISHTKQYAFLGFYPHHPIGVDIEQSHIPLDLPFEWCAMEAFLKAKGSGFAMNPLPDLRKASNCYISQDCNIYVYDDQIKGHKLAVCLDH
jgi:phosphopantetheinyl transferase